MPVEGEPPPETVRTLHALAGQTTTQWTLTVVIQDAWQTALTAQLAVSGLHGLSRRVRVERASTGTSPGELCRMAVAANAGAPMAFVFPGDIWAPDTVAQLSGALATCGAGSGVVYADEDELTMRALPPELSNGTGGDATTEAERHAAPRLKPAYSPEFLLSTNYTGRPLAVGSNITLHPDTTLPSLAALEHDIALQACEQAAVVTHLPEVLCHRIVGAPVSAPNSSDATSLPVRAALERRGIAADVREGPVLGTNMVIRRPAAARRISIIIPFRDEPRLLRSCLESIDATRGVNPVDFILINNGSTQPETQTLLERLQARPDVQILNDDRPFNWSALNNAAAARATGDVLLFLNNDIEARQPGWSDALAVQAMRADVGAVGARLVYPDGRVQHCGVVIGMAGAADHLLAGLDGSEPGYLSLARVTRECAAVTGACLAIRREVFVALDGFDDSLGVDLNDIDFCLRAQRHGLSVVYEAAAELVHHESPSRGFAGGGRDIVRFIDRWRSTIDAGDPFLNPHLSRVHSSCALRGPDEGEWWRRWYAGLVQT